MATAFQYSSDAIDSIALKSAGLSADEDSWASSTDAPSASEKLIGGLEEAMSMISEMLSSSADVMEKFKSEWDASLTSYQIDIGIIDEEIQRLAKEQKRRKKKASVDEEDNAPSAPRCEPEPATGPGADHALLFHLKSTGQGFHDGSDVFVLPPDEAEVEITELSDDEDERKPASAASTTSSKGKRDTGESAGKQTTAAKKKNEDEARFKSVSGLLSKMELYRNEEEALEKQLKEAHRDNGMTSLTISERQDLEDRLERCRVKQAEQVVASVTDYKPRFKASTGTNQGSAAALGKKSNACDLGLNLTPIEEILNGAMTDAVPIGAKSLKAKLARKANKLKSQPSTPKKENKSSPKTIKSKTPASIRSKIALVASTTDTKGTNKQVLSDESHLLTLNEIEIQKPGRSKVDRSLSAMIKSNTQSLNSLEMGRRNRVDR